MPPTTKLALQPIDDNKTIKPIKLKKEMKARGSADEKAKVTLGKKI